MEAIHQDVDISGESQGGIEWQRLIFIYDNPKIFIGKSAVTENIRSFIQRTALSNNPMLLLGETGVGKEVTARMIHRGSQRSEGPFIYEL